MADQRSRRSQVQHGPHPFRQMDGNQRVVENRDNRKVPGPAVQPPAPTPLPVGEERARAADADSQQSVVAVGPRQDCDHQQGGWREPEDGVGLIFLAHRSAVLRTLATCTCTRKEPQARRSSSVRLQGFGPTLASGPKLWRTSMLAMLSYLTLAGAASAFRSRAGTKNPPNSTALLHPHKPGLQNVRHLVRKGCCRTRVGELPNSVFGSRCRGRRAPSARRRCPRCTTLPSPSGVREDPCVCAACTG